MNSMSLQETIIKPNPPKLFELKTITNTLILYYNDVTSKTSYTTKKKDKNSHLKFLKNSSL